MLSLLGSTHLMSHNSGQSAPCALWPVDLRLTHLDWSPEATLIHFQGQYLTICDLDYNILQVEIKKIPKTKAAVDVGEVCLVEDLTSATWYRGRVQNRKDDLFDIFLIDHGNILSVDINHISSCSSDLFILPPKIVCGFLSNILLLQSCPHSAVEGYFASLIGKSVTGYIQALLPHKILLLEASDINVDLVRHGFGRHVDTDTFLLLVEMLTEVPLQQNTEPVPDLLIEKPRGPEFHFKSSGLQGYEDILSFCGLRLSCGTRAKVHVTAAVNPGLFYCQLVRMETDLSEMSKKLAEVCEYKTGESSPDNLGLLCSVKRKDGKWYRGFVQFLPVNSQVRVLFIDYGFFEFVPVDNVHRLPLDFSSTPIMAFPCFLSSLSDQDEEVKTQQLSFLKSGLLGEVLDIEIRSFDEAQHLYSITVTGVEDNAVKEPEPMPELSRKMVTEEEQLSSQSRCLNFEHATGNCNVLKVEEVQVGSVFEGYVEYVKDPYHFWIRTQKRNDEFKEMMAEMSEHFDQVKLEEDVLLKPEIGSLCCALYEEDMHFYRAVVTDSLEHGAEVLFIDFGNIQKVPHMLIKKIPERFANKLAFAIKCMLVNIYPLEEVWTTSTSNFFKDTMSNKSLLVHIVEMRRNKCVVDLHEMGSGNKQSITDLLVASKQADFWNNVHIEPVLPNNTRETRCPTDSETYDDKGKAERMEGWEQKDKTCKNNVEEAQSPASFKTLSIKPGCNFAVCCSYIKSPSDFWCQPVNKLSDLEKLMEDIKQYYSSNTVPLQPGDSCCVVHSPVDGRWYRGLITKRQTSNATVMLVDYGCTIQVRETSLQAILPGYTCLEGLAFRCSLSDLFEPAEPNNFGDWSPEVCTVLKKIILDSAGGLRCEVVSQLSVKNQTLCNVVDLYDTRTHQSVTKSLLERNLPREVSISTKHFSTVIPESFVYSPFDLSPGKEEQVFITHVSSQWEFYCHLERNTEIIEDLQMKISEESVKMIQVGKQAAGRKLCLAKYFDGKWYRGFAQDIELLQHLSVFFVDYGNTNISEKNEVMLIPMDCADLLRTPMQAVRCNLASVSKENLYADAKGWLDGEVLNKRVRAVVVGKNEDGSIDVELFDGDVNINKKLNEIILSHAPKPTTVQSLAMSSPKTTKQPHYKRNGSVSVSPSATTKSNRDAKSWTGSSSEKENRTKYVRRKGQIKSTKEEVPQLLCSPNMKVGPGFRAKGFASHVHSLDSFFLQLSEDEPAILKMNDHLNSSAVRDSLPMKTSPTRVHDFVLAEYEEDGALYRATVKDYEGSSCFKVEFVDYGNSAVIGKEKIYSMPEENVSQSRFSIPCSLLDTSMYQNVGSFTDAVMEKPLMVDFVHQCGDQWKVKVEIVGEAVDLLPTQEAAVETEKHDEVPVSLAGTEREARTCDENEKNLKSQPPPELTKVTSKFPPKCTRKKKTSRSNINRSLKIKAQDTATGTILAALSNNNCYVRLHKNIEVLTALESHIAENLDRCAMVAAEENVRRGFSCLVQVQEKKQWRRGVVQDVGQEKCKVFLVDHGITEEIPKSSIRKPYAQLAGVQGLAVLCKVDCFLFGNVGGPPNLWPDHLKTMVGKEVQLFFMHLPKNDKIWNVIVRQNTTAPQQSEEVVPSPAEEAEGQSSSETGPPHRLVFAPIDIDKAYPGLAAAVRTPSEFYIALDLLVLIMNKLSTILDDLPERITPLPEHHLVPGTCCLWKSKSTNKWCRAEIRRADTTVVLNLVDYGRHEYLSYKDHLKLRLLPEEVVDLPKVLYPCILRGVKPAGVDGQWTDEAAVFFQQRLYQKNLQIFFREFVSNTHWEVDILADGVHVAKELVDARHATYVDIMLGLRFQEQRRSCTADCEEECGQEDEGSSKRSHLSFDEARGTSSLTAVSTSNKCFLM